MEPTELAFERLQDMTDGFSKGRKLGQGAYGTVYRGVDKEGQEVAVKVLHKVIGPGLDDEDFKNEFANLKKLNHPHIVKLIGYCNETKQRCMEYQGRTVVAEETYRALCLEYLQNGSLQKFLSEGICDGRLDWATRFKIIKGAFEGLKYLHEEHMYHLDLKPDNILLDKNMVSKLADFGLSRIIGVDQTQITKNLKGTFGYMPPEFIGQGEISKMFDIFSMGAVMILTISGKNGRTKREDMKDDKKFIKQVHDSWRVKLQEKWSGYSLEVYCQQVKRCTEIALKCLEDDRKNRPNVVDIVHELSVLETAAEGVNYLSTVLEEPSSSFSEVAEDDPLPAIEGLRITGEAFPGRELQASGYSINGTTSCNFEWVRHLDDGSVNFIEGARKPTYLVTADDVESVLAIEVQPLDDRKRKGEIVKIYANDQRKITCDPETKELIKKILPIGHVSYEVLLPVRFLDMWEPAVLAIKREGYSIKCNGQRGVVITDKFQQATAINIPFGRPTEFSIICADGAEFNLKPAENAPSRDVIVLILRLFRMEAVEKSKGRRKGIFFK